MPPDKLSGRPRKYSWREIVNALFYITKTGCHRRLLPNDFTKWWTVYFYFRCWRIGGIWEAINDELRKAVRAVEGSEEEPTEVIIDSQSTKSTETSGDTGYDAGKMVNSVKRHVAVNVGGLIIKALVHSTNIQDRDGAIKLLRKARRKCLTLTRGWADASYASRLVTWPQKKLGINLKIIKRSDDTKSFKILTHRLVVERIFNWLGKNSRLGKNYERKSKSAESFICMSMTRLMIRRIDANPCTMLLFIAS